MSTKSLEVVELLVSLGEVHLIQGRKDFRLWSLILRWVLLVDLSNLLSVLSLLPNASLFARFIR